MPTWKCSFGVRLASISLAVAYAVGSGPTDGRVSAADTKAVKAAATVEYKIFAWNDLGMHCFDSDFSTFSLLPPFNTVHAQVVKKGTKGTKPALCGATEVGVTFFGTADPDGSINTTSIGKTNFWSYSQALFGAKAVPDVGLTGTAMPGLRNTPRALTCDTKKLWTAAGIPLTDIDDAGDFNAYSMMRFQAIRKRQTKAATFIDSVVPASSEMDCKSCHANYGIAASDLHVQTLGLTLSDNASADMQARENILHLHDILYHTDLWNKRPVLCASCHYSKALDLTGKGPAGAQIGRPNLSAAMHLRHGKTIDNQLPSAGNPAVISSPGVEACYKCHPGNQTNCLRSVMAGAGVGCQNCHGGLLSVGGQFNLTSGKKREPWANEPKCQSCHTGDFVKNSGGDLPRAVAFNPSDPAATPIEAPASRFAENAGKLYRDSTGHGGMACSACHGSPHAEWPAADPLSNDTLTPRLLQGHDGVIIECATCHGTSLSVTTNGPHGMHNVNSQAWVKGHEDIVEKVGTSNCKACHGLKGEGTYLSEAQADRSFTIEDKRTVAIKAGTKVSCTLCHKNQIK